MAPSPHPYRRELITRWTDFLSGRADRAVTVEYVEKRIADYGPEELVHSGLLLLNDDLLASGTGLAPSTERLDGWQQEVALFDEDPESWNRRWASRYARRMKSHLSSEKLGRLQSQLRDGLSLGDPSVWWIGLRRALFRLAAPAAEQAGYLRDLGAGDLVDELALEYEDYLLPTQTELNGQEYARGFLASCRMLDELLEDTELGWRVVDLSSDGWQGVREAAQSALTELDRIWPTAASR